MISFEYIKENAGIPSVLSVAGSDSSGGAGIQADIKTIAAHGLFAQTAITALTAQNTLGVYGVFASDPEFVANQIISVFEDIRPQAVKIGMLGNHEIAAAVAKALQQVRAENIVLDPVMVSTSGASLVGDKGSDFLFDELFSLASIVTPNLVEAQELSGIAVESEGDMVRAARIIQAKLSPSAYVLVKGGHLANSANDLLAGPEGESWFRQDRFATENSHGTGCTLSSAIACGLALGKTMHESVSLAKEYLNGALQNDPRMGKGNGPLDHMWAYR